MRKSQCTEVYFESASATFVSSKKVEDEVCSSLDLEISNFPLNLSVTDESGKLGRSSAHSAQCSVASVHSALWPLCTVAFVHSTLWPLSTVLSGLCPLCTVHCAQRPLHCTVHISLQCAVCIQWPLWIRVD